MANNEDMASKLLERANKIYAIGLKNINLQSPDGSLKVGDELQFTRNKRTFRFKISMKQGYSEDAGVLFTYTLSSIIETLDE